MENEDRHMTILLYFLSILFCSVIMELLLNLFVIVNMSG